jgi:hypothetical protein
MFTAMEIDMPEADRGDKGEEGHEVRLESGGSGVSDRNLSGTSGKIC